MAQHSTPQLKELTCFSISKIQDLMGDLWTATQAYNLEEMNRLRAEIQNEWQYFNKSNAALRRALEAEQK